MKFGILGTARIAREEMIPAIQSTGNEVTAIASRTAENAEDVADEFEIPDAYGAYENLLADADIEAVYVPLPNSEHAEWTNRAADAGLHVLCEKPLAVTSEEALEMRDHCNERGVTLMEAMMFRYHPRTERVADLVGAGLGDIRSMAGAFHSSLAGWSSDIRLDPEFGGGSLLDVGVYVITAARLVVGEPERVVARTIDREESGVDTHATAILEYEDGATASVSSSFDTADTQSLRLAGTDGWLSAPEGFNPPAHEETTITYDLGDRRVTETFAPTNEYEHEVEHFVECIEADESPRTNATEAARTVAVIEAIKESGGTGDVVSVREIEE